MRKVTDKQKRALIAWCDPALRRPPAWEDIAKRAGYRVTSVGNALKRLADFGYLDPDTFEPTQSGRNIARRFKSELIKKGK